jgi:hypothetical protein
MTPKVVIFVAVLLAAVFVLLLEVGVIWIGGAGLVVATVVVAIVSRRDAPRAAVEGCAAADTINLRGTIEEGALTPLIEWLGSRPEIWQAEPDADAAAAKIRKLKPLKTTTVNFRSTRNPLQWFKINLVCNKGGKYLVTITGEGQAAQEQVAGLVSQIGLE